MDRIRIRRPERFLQTPLNPFICVSSANGNPVHHLIFKIVFRFSVYIINIAGPVHHENTIIPSKRGNGPDLQRSGRIFGGSDVSIPSKRGNGPDIN